MSSKYSICFYKFYGSQKINKYLLIDDIAT